VIAADMPIARARRQKIGAALSDPLNTGDLEAAYGGGRTRGND